MVCCCVILKMECHVTFLPPWVVRQQLTSNDLARLWQLIASTWELFELENWKPNKLQTLFICKQSKENPTSLNTQILSDQNLKSSKVFLFETIFIKLFFIQLGLYLKLIMATCTFWWPLTTNLNGAKPKWWLTMIQRLLQDFWNMKSYVNLVYQNTS